MQQMTYVYYVGVMEGKHTRIRRQGEILKFVAYKTMSRTEPD